MDVSVEDVKNYFESINTENLTIFIFHLINTSINSKAVQKSPILYLFIVHSSKNQNNEIFEQTILENAIVAISVAAPCAVIFIVYFVHIKGTLFFSFALFCHDLHIFIYKYTISIAFDTIFAHTMRFSQNFLFHFVYCSVVFLSLSQFFHIIHNEINKNEICPFYVPAYFVVCSSLCILLLLSFQVWYFIFFICGKQWFSSNGHRVHLANV